MRGHTDVHVYEVEGYGKDLPHAFAKIRCTHCREVSIVIVPAPLDGQPLECPKCHQETRFNRMQIKEIRT